MAAGLYAGLTTHAPAKPFKPVAGPAAGHQPRGLSEKQRKIPLLSLAADRIAEEVRNRERRWLRRLDTIHASGCRTKQQRWNALGAMASTLLARLDLSNLCLGWFDDEGRFRLNRQRRLAESSDLTDCRVSRTLSALEAAGYVTRRFSRIYKFGQHWITRVTIHLRRRFFVDLGLGHVLAETVARARGKRNLHLGKDKARQQQDALQELSDAQQRRQSHRKAQAAREAKVTQIDKAKRAAYNEARLEAWSRLVADNPGASPSQLRELLERDFPPN
jgi:DNA-binding transcriptional ArsR family regulator